MTETRRASELTMEQIEDVLRDMNWTEIHKARVFSDYGDRVVLFTDGDWTVQGQSTYYRDPDAAGVIGYLSCWGEGNIDGTDYFEGWVEWAEGSKWTREDDDSYILYHTQTGEEVDYDTVIETETGRVLEPRAAIEEAIEEGDWDYTEHIDELLEAVKQEREAEHHA